MTDNFNITFAGHFVGATSFLSDLVSDFEYEDRKQIDVNVIPWDRLWKYLQRIAAGKETALISEIGTTWTGHFIESGSLFELTLGDIVHIGGEGRFCSSSWQSTMLLGDHRVFALPWLADTRVVYYWRNDLAAAGVDELSAFITPQKMDETLETLRRAGKAAWSAPTFPVNNTLHQIASWIWSYGGDFIDIEGKRTEFLEDPALRGICEYYELFRYMPHEFNSLNEIQDAFEDQKVSVTIDGPWYLMRMILGGASTRVLENLGVALPPGPPFVGGSNLVIWRIPGRGLEPALSLARHLLSKSKQRRICAQTGLLPVLTELLKEDPYATDAHYQVFAEALKFGRPLPPLPFWGLLEEALLKGFGAIWSELKTRRRDRRIEAIVRQHLSPVAKRFDRILRLI